MKDKVFLENEEFIFKVDDKMFYRPSDYDTLVIQAYEISEWPLPSWISFNPSGNIFFGKAP